MKRSFVVMVFLLASTFSSAQPADCAALTHQALELSGMNQSIEYLAASVDSDEFIQQVRGNSDSEEFWTAFKRALRKEFTADLLRKELQNRVAAHCDVEQMRQTVERLQTPLQVKMLALEAATNTADGQAKLQRYVNIARTISPTDERMEALDAIDASAGTSDFVTNFQLAMFSGFLTGAGAPEEIITQVKSHRKEIREQRQNYVELGMSVTYHGVTRPELLQYARELSAPPLKGFYAQVRKSFVEIVGERSIAIGQDLRKVLGPPKF
jgi:hypothetical protein